MTSWPPCLIGSIRGSVAGPPLSKEEGGGMKLENDSSPLPSLSLGTTNTMRLAAGSLGYSSVSRTVNKSQGGGLIWYPLRSMISHSLGGTRRALLLSLFTSLPPSPPPFPRLSTVEYPGAGRGKEVKEKKTQLPTKKGGGGKG